MTKFKFPLKITRLQMIGLGVAILMSLLSYIFIFGSDKNLFYFIFGISFVIGGFPFFLQIVIDTKLSNEKEEMFVEFSRGLVENVKAGTPISKSIFNIKNKNYGSLSIHIDKLSNQIYLGIPVKSAFETFARDIGSPVISRSVNIISESEKAGGKIDDILESVVKSVTQVEKLRKERKASMYTLVAQGYIIFLIFIVIMLVMQYQVLPIAASMGGQMGDIGSTGLGGASGILGASGEKATPEQMARPFLWLLITQGIFMGLVVGKLSDGNIKAGLKHSFILLILAILIQTGANAFLGSPMPASSLGG